MDLKTTRETMGKSPEEMAAACGVPRNTYYRWETGRRALPSVAHRLVVVLGWLHDKKLLDKALNHAEKDSGA